MDFSTFLLFSHLPAELRIKIWAYACQPRNVSLSYLPASDKIESRAAVPAILHANRESRYEALRMYSLRFATKTAPAQTYFSARLDTIYIPRYRKMGYDETIRDFRSFLAKPEDLDDVHRLALDYVEGNEKRPWEAYDKACLIRSFRMLDSVAVVLSKNRWNDVQHTKLQRQIKETPRHEFVFVAPREKDDEVMRACDEFREAWNREEEARKDVILCSGGTYQKSVLPPVEVLSMG